MCPCVRVHYRSIYQFHLKSKVRSCSLENGHSAATADVYIGVFLKLVQLLRALSFGATDGRRSSLFHRINYYQANH